MNLTPSDLLGLTVLAGFVGAVLNVLGKPLLKHFFPLATDEQWRVEVNLSALGLSLVFSFLALFALNQFTRVDLVQAILTGFSAAMIAIGGYEMQSNARNL